MSGQTRNQSDQRRSGKGAVDLIEEAAHLVRLAPLKALFWYYVGSIPFVLSLLFFWADMSRSADAANRLIHTSFLLALIFLWMKCCQVLFARHLWARILDVPPQPLSLPRLARLAGVQAAAMPWGLVILPLAVLVTLPFGWCWAFFQNVTVLPPDGDLRTVTCKAWRQAALWPAQNHLLCLILALFALFVFANLAVSMFLLPRLLRSLLGMETMFVRSNQYLLNSTFWCTLGALTYLCVDPLVKAVYLLRCHYGESLQSGADLLTELRGFVRPGGKGLLIMLLALTVSLPTASDSALAGESGGTGTSPPPRRGGVATAELDRSINEVINGMEFAWRLPRHVEQEKKSPPGFLAQAGETVIGWLKTLWLWMGKFFVWLAELLPKPAPAEKERNRFGWGGFSPVYLGMYLVLTVLLSAAGVWLWRVLRRQEEQVESVPTAVPVPDLTDENVTADELSEDCWTSLAKELLARGETRLGLRALYLASLSILAKREFLTIARSKSNREYELELRRRAHDLPELTVSFADNVTIIESVWYGMHQVHDGIVRAFMVNHERIVAATDRQ